MEERIITSQECISEGLVALNKLEPKFRQAINAIDEIPLRRTSGGFNRLLSTIVSQQLSVAAADAIWKKIELAGLNQINKIKKNLDDARKLKEDANSLLAEYERKIESANKEAENIINQAKKNSKVYEENSNKKIEEFISRSEKQSIEKIEQAQKHTQMQTTLPVRESKTFLNRKTFSFSVEMLINSFSFFYTLTHFTQKII